jgi:hypothetical protein
MSNRSAAARAAAALLCLAALPAVAATPVASSAGDQARFLAGLPVAPGSPLHALTQTPEWQEHQQAMDRAWPKLEERLTRAAAFQATQLAPLVPADRNVIYFFGGPDAAHAVKLFPGAPAYLLAGLESVGAVQGPEALKLAEWHTAVDGLASALRTFIDKSFFRTSEMGHDLQGKGIKGVQPVLYLFLARSGAEVLDATYFEVSPAGVATDRAPGERWGPGVPGVRVRFQFPGRPVQAMSYVRVNLLDDELARQPGFLAWAKGFAPATGFLKAASFILHDRAFSRPRAFLLDACSAILQDDSGVPYRVYKKSGWELTCFGRYLRPRDPFEGHEQKDLAEACAAQTAPLDFVIGYRRANDSALQLYVKRPGASVPPITQPPAPRPAAPEAAVPAAAAAPAALPEEGSARPVAPAVTEAPAEAPAPVEAPTPAPTQPPSPEPGPAAPAPTPAAPAVPAPTP